jgi:ER membrane protein SH3
MPIEPLILSVCGGFLLAVLWMDLMFDVQVLRHRTPELPEPVVSSIAAYYRRVTTTARPMGHLVAVIMVIAIATLTVQIVANHGQRGLALASLLVAGGPIVLAAVRVVPNAVRLGARSDTVLQQSALARSICRDHILCLIGILAFVGLQLAAATR